MAKKRKDPTLGPQPYREARRAAWAWHMIGIGNATVNNANGLISYLKDSEDYSDGLTNTEYQTFLKWAKLQKKMGQRMVKWGRKVVDGTSNQSL